MNGDRWEALAAAAVVGLISALVLLRGAWVADLVIVVGLLTVPGWLALRGLRHPGRGISVVVYVPLLSLLVLMLSGLAADLLGLWLGFRGLRLVPLLIAVDLVQLLLLLLALPSMRRCPLRVRLPRLGWPVLWICLPVLSAAGALLLSNGYGNHVSIMAAAATIVALTGALVFARSLSIRALAGLLYCAALALMWAFTLRGQVVYGYDISTELHIAQTVKASGVWHTAHSGDAYGAMLSVSILPATLSVLSGIAPLVLLKLIYPALFALYPVALFALALRYLRPPFAFVAGVFLIAQNWFFQLIPGIARQEIGLLFFAGLALALLEGRDRGAGDLRSGRSSSGDLPLRTQVGLVFCMGIGMVLGHYSTTYFAGGILLLVVAVQTIATLLRRRPLWSATVIVATITVLGGAAAWYAGVTDSTSNLTGFSSTLEKRGLNLLPKTSYNQGLVSRYLSGTSPSQVTGTQFQVQAAAEYAEQHPSLRPLAQAQRPQYALRTVRVTPRTALWTSRISLLANLFTELGYVLAAAGAALVGWGAWRRHDRQRALLFAFALATLIAVGLLRLSGTAAQAYNQQRGFVQTMIPLAVCIGFALQTVRDALPRWVPWQLAALVPMIIMVSTSSLGSTLIQGSGSADLQARGDDVDQFVLEPAELAAARWMQVVPAGAPVYTDAYGGLRLAASAPRSRALFQDIAPGTVDQHAWIYARAANFVGGYAQGTLADQKYAVYAWPRFVPALFDLMYTNGVSGVYHR